MQIDDKNISEFVDIYLLEYGIELEIDQAREYAENVMRLVLLTNFEGENSND